MPIRLAIKHHQEGNLSEAEKYCRKALSIAPANINTLLLLGIISLQVGKHQQAVELLNQVISSSPSHSSAYFILGNAYQAQGKLDNAMACFKKAISFKPDYAEAYNNLGVACMDQGSVDEALLCYQKAISLLPDFVEAHSNLGNVFKELKRLEDAIACFNKAISLNPDYAEAHYNLGVVFKEQGRSEGALSCFHKTILLKPDFAEAFNNLGLVLMEQGKQEEALACYHKALSLKPDSVETLINLGVALRARGKFGEALACFQQVIRLDPENGMAIHLIASLSGSNPERAPSEYIEKIFNAHADKFDEHLVGGLQYETPEKLVDLVRQFAEPPLKKWDILDLGCGTGLVGAAIVPYARQLVGVDISANMLEKARARHLYQRLEKADLLTMMQNETASSYDLIIAADVFVYLGKLDGIFSEAMRLLRPGGIFAFSVKTLEEMGLDHPKEYQLNDTGRYAHSATYLSRLAASIGFQPHKMVRMQARLEKGNPVQAWLVLFGRIS